MTETTKAVGLPLDEMPKFELAKMEIPAPFRDLADRGVAQAKAAAEEMTAVLEQTYSTAATGVADYNLKLIEMACANSNAAFEFACGLMAMRSLPEMVELSTEQTRKQFDLITAQGQELWALAERMATECAEPIKQSMMIAFSKVV
jgi:phasin